MSCHICGMGQVTHQGPAGCIRALKGEIQHLRMAGSVLLREAFTSGVSYANPNIEKALEAFVVPKDDPAGLVTAGLAISDKLYPDGTRLFQPLPPADHIAFAMATTAPRKDTDNA